MIISCMGSAECTTLKSSFRWFTFDIKKYIYIFSLLIEDGVRKASLIHLLPAPEEDGQGLKVQKALPESLLNALSGQLYPNFLSKNS